MPDLKFDSLEAVPEELRGDAKQVDGKFTVTVVSNKKLIEFRDNNINLARERDELKGRWSKLAPLVGEDPDKFVGEVTDLRTVAQQVKDGKLQAKGDIEAEIANRSKAKTESLEAQLREQAQKLHSETEEKGSWKQKYERSVLHQQITNAVVGKDSIANPEALPDILSRAEGVWHVQPDGKIVPRDGDQIIYGSDGATPMKPSEWLTKLVKDAPYLGKASVGGGATGGRSGEKAYGMSQEAFDKLSPSERIQRHRDAQNQR